MKTATTPNAPDCKTLFRTTDWSRTRFGPVESWPCSLRGYAAMVLDLPTPAILFWGPEQLQIYNDGYGVIMGPRHPRYFGAPYRDCWPDTYPVIHPWMERVLGAGEVIGVEDTLFPLTRHGFIEEAYFTFTFSPLRDDDGAIAGILQPVVETTRAVLARRRAETLRRLAPTPHAANVIADALAALAADDKDLPFVLLYRRGGDGALALGGGRGVGDGAALATPPPIVRAVLDDGRPRELDAEALLGRPHAGPWPEPTRRALVLPIRRSPSDRPSGVFVFGLSPRLPLDDHYRQFLEAVARELAASFDAEEATGAQTALLSRERSARAEADAQRARLHSIFMQAPTGITILRGRDYVVELANPVVCRLWGRSEEQVLGRPLFEVLPEVAGQGLEALLDGVRTTGVPYVGTELPVKVARLEGGGLEEVFFSFVYEPMWDAGGNVEAIIVIATDLTTQVRARQRAEALTAEVEAARQTAESANRAKDEFLAMLGHELRNPLSPILTALELIRLRDDGSAIARERAIIERQARHMARLVDDLLDVSRITRGKIELKKERIELCEIVAKAIETASPLLERAYHQLATHVPTRGLAVDADPARLTQVFANLLTNAAKYTEGGGSITVSAERRGDEIVASVADTGRGIAPEMLPRIFGLFEQERQNVDRSEGGLGLGLTIVKSLVELHGGRIEAESEGRGCGSTFTVRLPAATGTAALASSDAHPMPPPPLPPVAERPTVLVVDDNEDAATLLAETLETLGYAPCVAFDGARALVLATQARFDAALVDIGLPVIDGYEVARRLRELPGWRDTSLIAITGYGQDSDRRQSSAAGFDHHLVKPIDLTALAALLESTRRRDAGPRETRP